MMIYLKSAPLSVQGGAIEVITYSPKTLQLTGADQPPVFSPNEELDGRIGTYSPLAFTVAAECHSIWVLRMSEAPSPKDADPTRTWKTNPTRPRLGGSIPQGQGRG